LLYFFCHKAFRINTTLQDAGGRQQKKIWPDAGKSVSLQPLFRQKKKQT
jgi:hypothetical protein